MDPGFPGNFERIFQQYDRLVAGSKPDFEENQAPADPQAPVQTKVEESPILTKPRDEPPWLPDFDKVPEKSFGDM